MNPDFSYLMGPLPRCVDDSTSSHSEDAWATSWDMPVSATTDQYSHNGYPHDFTIVPSATHTVGFSSSWPSTAHAPLRRQCPLPTDRFPAPSIGQHCKRMREHLINFEDLAMPHPVPSHRSQLPSISTANHSEALEHEIASKTKLPILVPTTKTSIQNNRELHKCLECNRDFRYRKDLERHNRSKHVGVSDKWFCPVESCKFNAQGFSRKDKFFQHIKIHDTEEIRDTAQSELAERCHRPISTSWPGITTEYPSSRHCEALDDCATIEGELERASIQGHGMKLYEDEDPCEKVLATMVSSNTGPSTIVPSRMRRTENTLSRMNKEVQTEGAGLRLQKAFHCSSPHCNSGFSSNSELLRHLKTVHMDEDDRKGYQCAAFGCKKTNKIWTRLDNFKRHLGKKHPEQDIEELTKKSARPNEGLAGSRHVSD